MVIKFKCGGGGVSNGGVTNVVLTWREDFVTPHSDHMRFCKPPKWTTCNFVISLGG